MTRPVTVTPKTMTTLITVSDACAEDALLNLQLRRVAYRPANLFSSCQFPPWNLDSFVQLRLCKWERATATLS
jgi:hypothetical protein